MNLKRVLGYSAVLFALIAGFKIMTTSRAERNNNPLNIREGAGDTTKWLGESEIDTDSSFEVFDADIFGYRAAVRILRSYAARGVVSLESIIHTWAPATENDTSNYLAFVMSRTGFESAAVIDAYSESDVVALFAAMTKMERGTEANLEDIRIGFSLA